MSENQSEHQNKNQPKKRLSKLFSTSGSENSRSENKAGSPNNADGLVVEDVPRQMTTGNITPASSLPEPNTEDDDVWDVVGLPGTVNSTESTAVRAAAAKPMSTSREQELLTLIHDLNNCNDVLLGKVSKLEAALSESQQSVRAEVERAQTAQEKMLEQVLEQQSTAQQTAQTAQQQIAKLVGQLDTAEQTLQRQQLIQETLKAEINEAQERINQLERECALITQQHADEAQARIKAETTNRDLRSRLQRQQRYTLQFKAALEKSLTVTGSAAANPSVVSKPVSFNEDTLHSSVTMPRAERIIPWNAIGSAPFAGIDPHLENLIRGQAETDEPAEPGYLESKRSESVRARNSLETESTQPEPAAADQVPVVDIEAETKLWQDLERVMGIAAEVVSTAAIEGLAANTEAADAKETEKVEETAKESLDSEPRLNWQTKSAPLPIDPTTDPTTDALITTQPLPPVEPVSATLEAEQPPQPQPQLQLPQPPQQSTDYLPLIDSEASAVSPVVNPLRTQRKIGSMAAVQLPTFEKAKAGSFKR